MKKSFEFNLVAYNKMLEKIKNDLYPLVEKVGEYKIMSLNDLKSYLNSNEKINIVLVGPSSVGKSTIIKNLTGIDTIKTGQGVVTNSSSVYEWENMQLVDTPGIGTKLYLEHDDITKKAIMNADLLLFVVTNELFDNQSGSYFRELAKFKANEMFLVINKMNRTGNDEERQNVMKKSINKVVQPLLAEDYYVTFIDSVDYSDSLLEKDKTYSEILMDRSGYSNFYRNLNQFITEKSLYISVITSANKIIGVVDELMEGVELRHSKDNFLGDITTAKNNREKLETEKFLLYDNINWITNDAVIKIKNIGYQCANEIFLTDDSELQKKNLQRYEKEVNSIVESSNESIVRFLECDPKYSLNIGIMTNNTTNKGQSTLRYGAKANMAVGQFGQALQAVNGKGAAILRNIIKGKKSWLFANNKLAAKIKLGGIGLQVVSWGVGFAVDKLEENQRKEKMKNRQALMDMFYEFANNYREKVMIEVAQHIEEHYNPEIEKCNVTIKKITDVFKTEKDLYEQLEVVRGNARKLIDKIHGKKTSVV